MHRIPVEEMKGEKERGQYLHPEAFGQPNEKRIGWTKYPELTTKQSDAQLPGLKESHQVQQPPAPPRNPSREK
jgi:hypothetical protein